MAPGPGQDTPVGMIPGAPPMGLQKPATLPIHQPVGQQNLPIRLGMTKETPKGKIHSQLCEFVVLHLFTIHSWVI